MWVTWKPGATNLLSNIIPFPRKHLLKITCWNIWLKERSWCEIDHQGFTWVKFILWNLPLFQQDHFSCRRVFQIQFIEINTTSNWLVVFISSVPNNRFCATRFFSHFLIVGDCILPKATFSRKQNQLEITPELVIWNYFSSKHFLTDLSFPFTFSL